MFLFYTRAKCREIGNSEWQRLGLEESGISLQRSKVSNEIMIFMTDRA
jgi:hypothetical protein